MIISEYILSALQSIRSNKLRAGLSMLGIIIGVFSMFCRDAQIGRLYGGPKFTIDSLILEYLNPRVL